MFAVDINDDKPEQKNLPNDEDNEPVIDEVKKSDVVEEDKKQAEEVQPALEMFVEVDKISEVIKEGAEVVQHIAEEIGMQPNEGEVQKESNDESK